MCNMNDLVIVYGENENAIYLGGELQEEIGQVSIHSIKHLCPIDNITEYTLAHEGSVWIDETYAGFPIGLDDIPGEYLVKN